MPDRPAVSPSDYLAAERTFLAWIRTGLALMGFGFVVARFGLFLEALQVERPNLAFQRTGLSPWFGAALIVLGIVVTAWSAWGHLRFVRQLNRGGPELARPSSLAMTLAAVLTGVGLAMAIYLVSVRASGRQHFENIQEKSMTPKTDNGIVTIQSHQSVDLTVRKVEELLRTKGVKLFALIDHSGEAEKAGMPMRPTKLLIFGNPKAGTPLMLASPTVAIDLPLKILVWEDVDGSVRISYDSPSYLQARHNLPAGLLQNIGVLETLAIKAAE